MWYVSVCISFGLFCGAATLEAAQCPLLAMFPATIASDDLPEERARFELRQCMGRTIWVYGYKRLVKSPSLRYDTGNAQLSYLVHSYNVLVLQGVGGTSEHVHVLVFQNGSPRLVGRTATKEHVDVRVEYRRKTDERVVIVAIPPVVYPGDQPLPTKRYEFVQEF